MPKDERPRSADKFNGIRGEFVSAPPPSITLHLKASCGESVVGGPVPGGRPTAPPGKDLEFGVRGRRLPSTLSPAGAPPAPPAPSAGGRVPAGGSAPSLPVRSPLRLQTPRAPELPPHARGQVQLGPPFPEAYFPVSSFLIDTISPSGSSKGIRRRRGPSWGNPRGEGLRPRGFWWLTYIPLARCLFPPRKFGLSQHQQGVGREGVREEASRLRLRGPPLWPGAEGRPRN